MSGGSCHNRDISIGLLSTRLLFKSKPLLFLVLQNLSVNQIPVYLGFKPCLNVMNKNLLKCDNGKFWFEPGAYFVTKNKFWFHYIRNERSYLIVFFPPKNKLFNRYNYDYHIYRFGINQWFTSHDICVICVLQQKFFSSQIWDAHIYTNGRARYL